VLALTRQALPTLRTEHQAENLCARGGYVLAEAGKPAKVTLIATGSEVMLAMEARAKLETEGIGARVVSMACTEFFDAQDAAYRKSVLDEKTVRVAIEAASPYGWERYVGPAGAVIGINSFGASAPAGDLYKHFDVTAEAAVAAAKQRL
jgi:transketolase